MKGMKFLPVILFAIMVFGTMGTSILKDIEHKKEVSSDTAKVSEDDSYTYDEEDADTAFSWEEPPVPDFLAKYMDSSSWGIDTICVANGKAYYHAYDNYRRTGAIYTLDEMLCEDPTLYHSASSSQKTIFRIATSTRSLTVNFADKRSVEKLKSLIPKFRQTTRFSKSYFSDDGNMILYHIDIDYPKKIGTADDNIRNWLVKTVNESLDFEDELPVPTAIYIAYNKQNYGNWKYSGNLQDVKAIGRFASDKYFAIKKLEYGDDEENYPSTLFYALSLRLVSSNGKYFSYQKYTHDYNGGAHGYYTEKILSFDPINNKEIDWNYLFKPNCEKAIIDLFYMTVMNDPDYNEWENTSSISDIREHFEDSCEEQIKGNHILPRPGLTDKGVVFSFQPYAISCFAAGCFHFTIPYSDLKPYLTTRAKKLLDIG